MSKKDLSVFCSLFYALKVFNIKVFHMLGQRYTPRYFILFQDMTKGILISFLACHLYTERVLIFVNQQLRLYLCKFHLWILNVLCIPEREFGQPTEQYSSFLFVFCFLVQMLSFIMSRYKLVILLNIPCFVTVSFFS